MRLPVLPGVPVLHIGDQHFAHKPRFAGQVQLLGRPVRHKIGARMQVSVIRLDA